MMFRLCPADVRFGVAWVILSLAVVTLTTSACEADGNRSDVGGFRVTESVESFLGPEAAGIIAEADRIEPFMLKASLVPGSHTGPDAIGGYRWMARGADLATEEVIAFKQLLLDEQSYDFDIVKKCVMVPEYAFRFSRGDRRTVVLVSLDCLMWGIRDGREVRVEDFDPVERRLKAIIETVFKIK
jgi:hypothetical protein